MMMTMRDDGCNVQCTNASTIEVPTHAIESDYIERSEIWIRDADKHINLIPPSNPICFVSLYRKNHSTGKLLDAVVPLARDQRQRHDARHVGLRTEDLDGQAELLADGLDVLETFLVVGTGTANPDLDLVLVELAGDLTQGTDDTLEC